MYHPSMKAKLTDLEARKAALEAELAEAPEAEPIRKRDADHLLPFLS
jgi:hypothetical protein